VRASDGFNFDGVLGDDGDLFAAEFDCAIGDGGFDLAIDGGELEVGCAELGELADEAVGMGAVDAGVLGAELLPSKIEAFVSFGVVDLLEAGDACLGAVVSKGIEGLFPAYPGSDSYGFLAVSWFGHAKSPDKTEKPNINVRFFLNVC
jgi:hypothetical protein